MTQSAKPIPEGKNTIIPHLTVRGAQQAIDFYKRAFGAQEVYLAPGPDGKSLMHAEIKIRGSMVFLAEEQPEGQGCGGSPLRLGGTPVVLNFYVEDVDAAFQRAVKAGAKPEMPPADMFWGDRYCQVTDPFGHRWALATHKEDLTGEQIGKRAQEFFAQMAGGHK
jgi:uncharacterized glyoxalase superfamily protein PhnB